MSWTIETEAPNWRQAAYEIQAHGADGAARGQTGRSESDQSVLIPWPFAPLVSRERVSVRVRVWGADGSASAWSEPLALEAGLLAPDDWSARFVTPDWDEDPAQVHPAPFVRRAFTLRAGIRSARLYITALGLYEAQLNGQVVGDSVLAPGWTVYDRRLRYQTYDVTGLLVEGRNALGAILGDGWFRGRLGFGGGHSNIYGERLALLAQLEVEYADGSRERIVTDDSWRATTGPIRMSGLYDGETYDARLELPGWSTPGCADTAWRGTRVVEWDLKTLEAPLGPPMRRIETIAPVSITASPSGKTLVDFGQNLVGRLSIRVRGAAGQTVTLRHAEVLEHAELGTRPLRYAKATDRYTLKGDGVETWEPRFTFHGFRYVEVQDWPGVLEAADLSAVVIHSDLERTGWFETSDAMLNQLHANVVWGMRGNFLDVPTDCPQRDERLGWTGDLEVFSPTASFLFDSSGFLQSWLRDLAVEQAKSGGAVPHVVPNVLGNSAAGAAAWADAATIVPWVLYQRFGDVGILTDQFESMRAWVDHVAEIAGEGRLWNKGFQFGDWLDPTAPSDRPAQARTDKAIVASAYFVRSADLVAQTAAVLGRVADERRYRTLAAEARAAFAREYVTAAGRMMNDAETAYALALAFDLLPTAEQRQRAGQRLAELARESGYRIRTGFVGTPLMCDALCSAGQYVAAYRLLLQRECPSWLYPITMGATTIWERWDSMLPDGSINPGEMTSFNHYALGAVADWMHRTIGGLTATEPGYRRLAIRPRPGGGITSCRTEHRTPYGRVAVAWAIDAGTFNVDVVVPPNTSAEVTLPGAAAVIVGSGVYHWSVPYQDPDARGPFTVDDLVGDVLSEQPSRAAVMAGLERAGTPEFVRGVITGEPNLSLRQALRMAPNYDEALRRVGEALAAV
ncbi:MAG: glycoside hydrolase family 78 protein [Anaerolineales bacterium]|nr:glycoside hydrolase family 78 protein [Anaerolineales bacterium]